MPIERRLMLKSIAGAGFFGFTAPLLRSQEQVARATRGMATPRIKDISVIECEPAGVRLTVVKITTDQDGLYGYGCATFTQRADLVKPAVEKYLKPFLLGQDHRPDRRYLAVLLRQLLLEKRPGAEQRHQRCRSGAVGHQGPAGRHAGVSACRRQMPRGRRRLCACGRRRLSGCRRCAKRFMAQGFRNVRVQVGIPGMSGYGAAGERSPISRRYTIKPLFEPAYDLRRALKLLEICRQELGEEVELAPRHA